MAEKDSLRACVEQQAEVATTKVEGALHNQINLTKGHLAAVTRRLTAVQQEVQHLRNHMVKLEVQLKNCEQPMKLAMKRQSRNDGDAADQMLDKEAAESKSMSAALSQSYNEMLNTRNEMETMENVLSKQAQWLRRSLMRDNECVTSAPCRRIKKDDANMSDVGSDTSSTRANSRAVASRAPANQTRIKTPVKRPVPPKKPAEPQWVRDTNGVKVLKLIPPTPMPPPRPAASDVGNRVPHDGPFAAGGTEPREVGKHFFLGARRRIKAGPGTSGALGSAPNGPGGRSASSFSDILNALTWEEEVNQAYTQAHLLVDHSSKLRQRLAVEVAKRELRCDNVRKQVLESMDSNITLKMEGKQRMLNNAKRIENDIHNLKKEWKNTADTAARLANPISITGERQKLRRNVHDGVGQALEVERVTLRQGRAQLKAKCKVMLQTLISQEKEKNHLFQQAGDVEADIKIDRKCMKSDNPMSTGLAPRPPKILSKKVGLDGRTNYAPPFEY